MTSPLILLAGGKSSRAGSPKGLLLYREIPWVQAQVKAFRSCGGGEVFLVLGYEVHDYDKVELQEVRRLINTHPEYGPFSSIQLGVRAVLERRFSSAFVLPIDVPAAGPEVWRALESAMKPGVKICQPVFKGADGHERGGHPVLLSEEQMNTILRMPPTDRLDQKIHALKAHELMRVFVHDERVLMNLNTPESWDRFLKQSGTAG